MDNKDVKKIGRKYAEVLFDLCEEKDILDKTEKKFRDMLSLFPDNPDLMDFLKDPRYTLEERKQFIGKLAEFFGLEKVIGKFLFLMVDNNHLSSFFSMIKSFRTRVAEKNEIIAVTFQTAEELSEEDRSFVEAYLQKKIQKSLSILYEVKESLLGGFVVYANGKTFNASISGQLHQFQQTVKGLPS